MDKVVAIIAAAGQGTRMGAPVSKVYLDILGRPLLAYTLDKFQKSFSDCGDYYSD